MPELLLELFSEEIPARMQARAADDLKRLVTNGLKKEGLEFESANAYATPRRLTLVVDGLPEKLPEMKSERKGPQVGAPEQAIAGFLKSAGLSSLDDCEIHEVKGKQVYFAVSETKGPSTRDILLAKINDSIRALPWPKSMRWESSLKRWVRPLHSIIFVFNGEPFQGFFADHGFGSLDLLPDKKTIPLGSVPMGNQTCGHRFLSPKPFAVNNFADYKTKLLENKVMLDAAERREKIWNDAEALAGAEGLSVRADDALLDEVAGLVEWPVTLMGGIDLEFMAVPHEALIATMRGHQKYFSVLYRSGRLTNRFIFVSNMETADGGKAIVAGNERVLRARLSDVKFFWDQDRQQGLESRLPRLASVIFHAKLGTMLEKVERLTALAGTLSTKIPDAEDEAVERAAKLCKADLVTGMVGELPELQGLMGYYFALEDGEDASVAEAIAEHYSPAGPNDACPSKPASVALALADKIDTLVGFFAIDEKPTGSKDPFALRRAALGVIRLIVENNLRVPITKIFNTSYRQYEDWVDAKLHWDQQLADDGQLAQDMVGPRQLLAPSQLVVSGLLDFFADRLIVQQKEKGTRDDLIKAVFPQRQTENEMPGDVDLVRVLKRVASLESFLATEDGANLLVAYRRADNIVRKEQKNDGKLYKPASYIADLAEGVEEELWHKLQGVEDEVKPKLKEEHFSEAMELFSKLREPVDKFFNEVKVNVNAVKLRKNRLCLLAYLVWLFNQVADFSKIEG